VLDRLHFSKRLSNHVHDAEMYNVLDAETKDEFVSVVIANRRMSTASSRHTSVAALIIPKSSLIIPKRAENCVSFPSQFSDLFIPVIDAVM
jgi:hypothetical protein